MKNNILEMTDITKTFPGTKALNNVNFSVRYGEVHALIGENGAGKSTLMKILLGMQKPDNGTIIYKGAARSLNSPYDALKCGISMIHQELSLVPERTVAENILIGRESTNKFGMLNWKRLYSNAHVVLNKIGLQFNPGEAVKNLTVAQQQMVEIARAISYESDLIIMDEPTSALSSNEIDNLFSIIDELRKKNVSVIFISHKLEEIFQIADRTTVLRDGELVGVRDNKDFNSAQLVEMMVGRELNQIFPKEKVEIGEEILEVRNLTRNGYFRNINFKIRKGEILGFSGLMGSGRTEVMRAIFGIDKYDSGEIIYNGKKVIIDSPKKAINLGLGMVTEDRKKEGLCLPRSVTENISMVTLDNYCRLSYINERSEVKHAETMINMLGIKTPSPKMRVNSLSGGNQQKVIIAKWLSGTPQVIILDEPTRGIDVGAKSEIHKLMTFFAKKGLAVLMVSSELPEILGMSDRIIVMAYGEIKGEFSREEATQKKIMHCALSHK